MNYIRQSREKEGEDKSVQICMGRDGGLFTCVYRLYTPNCFFEIERIIEGRRACIKLYGCVFTAREGQIFQFFCVGN